MLGLECWWYGPLVFWRILFAAVVPGLAMLAPGQCWGASARDYAVEISAVVEPSRIALSWRPTGDEREWLVRRKGVTAGAWEPGVVLPASQTSFVDSNVALGQSYEYSVTKYPDPTRGSGYIAAGMNIPLVEDRGNIILIVDNTFSLSLGTELARLESDMAGDGWKVIRHDVSRGESPATIRTLIRNDYFAEPSKTRALLLFGHVPVPRSGNYNADDHENHTGAWVADSYYGDVNGDWTDTDVLNISGLREANWNRPGDGKFDQSIIPSDVELAVGRVDMAGLDVFSPRSEEELLRNYLNKNHQYRHGLATHRRRGLIYDGFGESGGDAYAASGWRNFKPLLGEAIEEIGWEEFFPKLNTEDYLWTYAGGGGDQNYMECYGVGVSANFAATEIKGVFHMIFGSYFGDWDAPNNFIRAALASGDSLAVAWAGRPHWFFHHMGLGETIGVSTRVTQNNQGLYYPTNAMRGVHVSLLGDPALRMDLVKPPSNFAASNVNGSLALTWSASSEGGVEGYHLYRATNAKGPFVRITSNPTSQTTFRDTPLPGTYHYMVKTVKLQATPSGSFYNASQGIFVAATMTGQLIPVRISQLSIVSGQIIFECVGSIGQAFVVEQSNEMLNWSSTPVITLTEPSWTFRERLSGGARFYRLRTL